MCHQQPNDCTQETNNCPHRRSGAQPCLHEKGGGLLLLLQPGLLPSHKSQPYKQRPLHAFLLCGAAHTHPQGGEVYVHQTLGRRVVGHGRPFFV